MILITSAGYVDAELQSEFGRLPNAFLPVGNRRLFERQVQLLAKHFPGEIIYLSLPDDFALTTRDRLCMERAGVSVVLVPVGLSLAESVLYVINAVAEYSGGLRVLHGDTLFSDLPSQWDCISVAESADDYAWHIVDRKSPSPLVWAGFFSFSSIADIARCLVASRGRFDLAVSRYEQSHALNSAQAQGWLDFGHVNTFFRSRAQITTQRAFNHLQIRDHRVCKSGEQAQKIAAEAHWFESLPRPLRAYAPQLLHHAADTKSYHYELEYLCFAPLNELYVHGANPVPYWLRLFRHLCQWFADAQHALALSTSDLSQIRQDTHCLLVDKTLERMGTFLRASGLNGNAPVTLNGKALPSLNEVVDICLAKVDVSAVVPGVLHGDLCFSNVLFDSRADRIKLIDPRGMAYNGTHCITGDLRYDLAKLTHSVCGYYDFIIAGAFDIDEGKGLDFEFALHIDDRVEMVAAQFLDLNMLSGFTPRDVMPQVVLLFLSMLPLHADSPRRQRALLANGLRLFEELQCKSLSKSRRETASPIGPDGS